MKHLYFKNVDRIEGKKLKNHLSLGFIAVKRHCDHGSSYKEQHLVGAGLQVQRFCSLSSWWGAGRHGAGEGAEILRGLHLLFFLFLFFFF